MLSNIKIERYKSLFDTSIDLAPLTVLIGPNGSGKSNICEAISILSNLIKYISKIEMNQNYNMSLKYVQAAIDSFQKNVRVQDKFWHGETEYMSFEITCSDSNGESTYKLEIPSGLQPKRNFPKEIIEQFRKVSVYDFSPSYLSQTAGNVKAMDSTGEGIAYSLVDVLHGNREAFDELEDRFAQLVPNIKRISLPRGENQTFELKLVDKYSNHRIPASDISDGTLRILAFLTSIYQEDPPSILCFEELENGVHPWLLHKMMELLNLVANVRN